MRGILAASQRMRAVLVLLVAVLLAMLKLNAAWAGPEPLGLRWTVPTRTPVAQVALPVVWKVPQAAVSPEGGPEDLATVGLHSTAHLRVAPSIRTVALGTQFALDVFADLPSLAVYGVECILEYDANYLEVLTIHPDLSSFGHVFVSEADHPAGIVRYQAGLEMGSASVSGTVRLFSLTIAPRQVTAETSLAFGDALVALSGGESILPDTTPGSVTILAPTATPTATSTATATVTPTATQTPIPVVTATSQTSNLDLEQDTYIDEWAPDSEQGGAHTLNVRSGGVARALVQFALADGATQIPPSATVIEARLRLYNTTSGRPPITIAAYGLQKAWTESGALWAQSRDGVPWDAPGASAPLLDRDEVEQGAVTLQDVGWYDWEITELVQRWAREPEENHGVLLMSIEGPSALYGLASHESPDAEHAPELVVTWRQEMPTPTPTLTMGPSGVIHGRVFEDQNGDGAYQTEEGVPEIVLQASRDGEPAPPQTTITDAQGIYRFGDLVEGWYSLTLTHWPANYVAAADLPISIQALAEAPPLDIELVPLTSTTIHLPLILTNTP